MEAMTTAKVKPDELDQITYTVSALAKLLMISERRVQQLTKEGVIPKEGQGKYHLVPSVHGYLKLLQQRAAGASQPSDYHTEKARLVKLQADKAQIDLDILEEKLIFAADVQKAWENVLMAFKSKLMAIPTKAAPVIAAETQPGQIQQILDDLVRETLAELANYDPEIDPTAATSIGSEGDD